jgi:sarcosine oxidase subunit gamma
MRLAQRATSEKMAKPSSEESLIATEREINQMRFAQGNSSGHSTTLGITDLSFLTRFGVKGAAAAAWLHAQNLPIPDAPNRWLPLRGGGLIARLGFNEFLIEDSINSSIAPQLIELSQHPPAKVYPVLRQDAAIALGGSLILDLLAQTCSLHFRALNLSECPVVLTTMVGVNVTIIPGEIYRIWCDGTYGVYLWQTLLNIIEEMQGGAVEFEQLLPL